MKKLLRKLDVGNSYTSLVIGVLVVVIAGALLVTFVRRQGGISTPTIPLTEEEQQQTSQQEQVKLPAKHTVVEGETLWTISEKYYKSGYNWVDVAQANNLANPDLVASGTELTIPDTQPKVLPETGITSTITGDTYTVVQDDTLWDIAVRAYGDGFKWVEISKANNLPNPDLIHPGNVLKLPR